MDDRHVDLGSKRDRALVFAALAAIGSRFVAMITMIASIGVAAHSLSQPELGVVSVLTALTLFLGFGDFGLGTLLMTRLPAANARSDVQESQRIITVTTTTLSWIGSAICAAGVASGLLLSWQGLLGAHALPAHEVRNAVIAFFICGGLSIPATIGSRVLAAMQRSALTYVWNAVASIVSLALTIACAMAQLPMWTFVVALAGAPGVVGAVQTIWVLHSAYPQLRPRSLLAPWSDISEFLRAGSLFAIMTLSAVIAYAIDSLVVSSQLGASGAAVFAVAARMFTLVGSTLVLAGQQLWSALADALARGHTAWVRSRYRHTLVISTTINSVACVVLIVVGRPLVRVWVGKDLVPPLSLLIVLGIWTVYSTAVTQASYLLAAAEKVKTIALAGLVMAAVNLAVSIGLTQRYGLVGPILGSIIAQLIVMTVPLIVLTRRELRRLGPDEAPTTEAARHPVGRHRIKSG